MTREKEIDRAATHYNYGYNEDSIVSAYCCFRDGAKWADANPKSPWISVSDDLPCNHSELILQGVPLTQEVLVIEDGETYIVSMYRDSYGWQWTSNTKPEYWMPIPNIPHEE